MITSQQAETYGMLFGIFAVAALAQWNAYKARKHAEETADKLEEVNRQKSIKIDTIHALVNSGLTEQLRTIMVMSRQLAESTKNEVDVKVATEAENKYNNHVAQENNIINADKREAKAFDAGVVVGQKELPKIP